MTDLRGKRAIVTGAAVGLGRAYAHALAAKGVDVAVCDLRPEIESQAAELQKQGVRAVGFVADVSQPGDVRRVVDGARETKPEIPETGERGVPIHDEIVMELSVEPYLDE